jgi:hypothetical protein
MKLGGNANAQTFFKQSAEYSKEMSISDKYNSHFAEQYRSKVRPALLFPSQRQRTCLFSSWRLNAKVVRGVLRRSERHPTQRLHRYFASLAQL